MRRYVRKSFLLHSRLSEYKTKLANTINIIDEAISNHNCYVSYSGGKDSTVLTHLALSIEPDVCVWHWDYGDDLMPREYEEEVISNMYSLGVVNAVVNKRVGDGSDTSSGYKQFFNTIASNKSMYGWDMGLVGVRREESVTRKNRYRSYFQDGDCFPLLDWSSSDVWAYIVSNDLAYHSTYDYTGEVRGWDNARFVTFFDPEFETLNIWDNLLSFEYLHK